MNQAQSPEIRFWSAYLRNAKLLVALMFVVGAASLAINFLLLPKKYEFSVTFWARKSGLNDSPVAAQVETYRGLIMNNTLIDRVMDEFSLREEPFEMRLHHFKKSLKFKTKRQSEGIELEFLFKDQELGAKILNRLADLAVEKANLLLAGEVESNQALVRKEYEEAKEEFRKFTDEWMSFRRTAQVKNGEEEVRWRGLTAMELFKGPNILGDADPVDLVGLAQIDGLIAARQAEIDSLGRELQSASPQLPLREFKGEAPTPQPEEPNGGAAKKPSSTREEVNPFYASVAPRLAVARAELAALTARKAEIARAAAENDKAIEALEARWGPNEALDLRYQRQMEAMGYAFQQVAAEYQEARITALANAETVHIVDRAVVPDASARPRKALNTALALIAAFVLASLALFAREYFDQLTDAMKEDSPK